MSVSTIIKTKFNLPPTHVTLTDVISACIVKKSFDKKSLILYLVEAFSGILSLLRLELPKTSHQQPQLLSSRIRLNMMDVINGIRSFDIRRELRNGVSTDPINHV
jgi:hypothetical protein